MIEGIDYNHWETYFKEFNSRNRWRPTRLVVFNRSSPPQETESGMPLVGVQIEPQVGDCPRIHIMLGEHEASDPRHQSYTIACVKQVKTICCVNGQDEALEIEDNQGIKTQLQFQPLPIVSEMRY